MVKKFFFACVGFLCIALAYHLGARSAESQSIPAADCFGVAPGHGAAAVVGRTMYIKNAGIEPTVTSPQIPGSARVVACAPYIVLLENGDVYSWTGNDQPWDYNGALTLSGPVPAQRESWGAMKQRYR